MPQPLDSDESADSDDTGESDETADILARFPATDLGALLGDDRPERRWTVEGFLSEGGGHSLVAGAGTGKSLLALHCGLCVAQGAPFLGRPTRRQRVVYIDLENSETDLAERLDALGITEDQAARLTKQRAFIHLCLPPIDPLDTSLGAAILAAILDAYETEPGDLLVLDSSQRMVSGDENSADTWRAFYRHTATMLKRRRITVLRLDNHGKDAGKGPRGSSSKTDDVDAEWQLRRGQDLATENGNYLTIAPTKGRMLSSLAPIEAQYVKRPGGLVSFNGIRSTQDADILAAIRLLDRLDVPRDAGQITAWDAVKDRDDRPTRAVLRSAVRKRKTAMPTTAAYPPQAAYAEQDGMPTAYPPDAATNPQVKAPGGYADHERHSTAYPSESAMPYDPPPKGGHTGRDHTQEPPNPDTSRAADTLTHLLGATPVTDDKQELR